MVEDTCVNYAEHELHANNTFVAIAKQVSTWTATC